MIKKFEQCVNEWKKIETTSIKLYINMIKLVFYVVNKLDSENSNKIKVFHSKYFLKFYEFLNKKDIINKIEECEKDKNYEEALNYINNEWKKSHPNLNFKTELEYVISHLEEIKLTNKNLNKIKKLKTILNLDGVIISNIDPYGEENWNDESV